MKANYNYIYVLIIKNLVRAVAPKPLKAINMYYLYSMNSFKQMTYINYPEHLTTFIRKQKMRDG